jgi:hypothetical protein
MNPEREKGGGYMPRKMKIGDRTFTDEQFVSEAARVAIGLFPQLVATKEDREIFSHYIATLTSMLFDLGDEDEELDGQNE